MFFYLQGNYLSTFLRIDGVSITVDGVPCNITDYSADVIFCIPPKSDNVEADRGEAPVVVSKLIWLCSCRAISLDFTFN